MSPRGEENVGHSVFQRLLNHAKTNEIDFNHVLLRYGIERLLYRLSISAHADRFVLKGASLFLVWKGHNYRVTKDADLLAYGSSDVTSVTAVFRELCQISCDDDGIEFIADSVAAIPIREEHAYDGIRVTQLGMLWKAKVPLQVDIGFGDIVTPPPEKLGYPTILDNPTPQLLAYSRYTMVAEKFEAMVRLGMANSRLKDFYDIWLSKELFTFDGKILCEALINTFERRKTPLPSKTPIAFTAEFGNDRQKLMQWRAFIRKAKPENTPEDLSAVVSAIALFLMPVVKEALGKRLFEQNWPQGGPWEIGSRVTEDRNER